MSYSLHPIGTIHSPYKEKFAVPRQPRLVPSATASIALQGDINCLEAIRGLEQFSHLWLLFLFDQNLEAGWKPTVRPPRLGGNERIGVLASRATFRPNGIGMSAVEFRGLRQQGQQVFIDVGSVDLVDGTPIIDIKPYIPYSDSVTDAKGGYAESQPEATEVIFSDFALEALSQTSEGQHKQQIIREVLAQDPRPAYKKDKLDDKEYGVRLFDWNVKFKALSDHIVVTAIEAL
ncbi:tRNA (N6-threonylcarbamoyladenosine(37)-N6)-methyltransferase TrmO [Vibrio maritimus]|uniref:tRNA (N6-threonylcarbamoyladenosine(37)-N6)-methyltransferase TrmO n=1 Tax=Vibrio maritimus TaxID=990268 RepID=UPI0040689697